MFSTPSPTLAECLAAPRNNLDFIRFVAASGVVLSHCFAMGEGLKGTQEPLEAISHRQLTIGLTCVAAFLVISGLLVTQSWERRQDPRRFILARTLRIFPGLVVSLLLTAFVLGPVFTSLPLGEYFSSPGTYEYVLRNVTLIEPQWELPGVFETNAYPKAVNGALWTLKYEAGFYLLLVGAGLAGWLRRQWVLAAWVLLAMISLLSIPRLSFWPDLGVFFGGGLTLYLWRDRVRMNGWVALACAAVVAGAALVGVGGRVALGSCGAYAVLCLAFIPSRVASFGDMGDFSYGIYVYGFPVQQAITALLGGYMPWWLNVTLALPCAILLGALSWHFVEKPALALTRSPGRESRRLLTQPFRP